MVDVPSVLTRDQVIEYVGQHAGDYGVDPAAVLAVANHEGLNTAPGSSWTVPGERNISFGPPSWFGNGAGAALLAKFGGHAPAWAWSTEGINYWLQQVSQSAKGLTGTDAIRAIVTGFERPRADLVQGEIDNASHDYAAFRQAIGGGASVIGGLAPVASPAPTIGSQHDITLPGGWTISNGHLVGPSGDSGWTVNPDGTLLGPHGETMDPSKSGLANALGIIAQAPGAVVGGITDGVAKLGDLINAAYHMIARLMQPGFWWAVLLFVGAAAAIIAGVLLYSKGELLSFNVRTSHA